MKTLTDTEIAALRAMPWEHYRGSDNCGHSNYVVLADGVEVCGSFTWQQLRQIVTANNAMPALLAHIAAQSAEIEDLIAHRAVQYRELERADSVNEEQHAELTRLREETRWRDAAVELPEPRVFVDVVDSRGRIGIGYTVVELGSDCPRWGFQSDGAVTFWDDTIIKWRPRPTAPMNGEVSDGD